MNNKFDNSVFNGFIKKKKVIENKTKNVLIYTRVSSKNQAENNDSLNLQKNNIERFCKEKGYNIIDVFGGTYESAKGDYSREEFSKLINYIKKQRTKPFGVVVNTINRFSRSGASSIGILNELVENQKVHLIEVSSGMDTSTQRGYIYITEKLLDSRKENLVKQETIIPSMVGFLSKGFVFGKSPIGYDQRTTDCCQ